MPNTKPPAGPPAVAGKPATFDPATAGWQRYEDKGFIGLVGPFWMRPCGNSYLYAFMAEPKHENRRGVVQGGMLMTFADRSMGMTCWYANARQPQATVQLDVHFIDAVAIGEFVEAKCRVVRRTRSLIFMSGELVVGQRIVATANGVWKTLGGKRMQSTSRPAGRADSAYYLRFEARSAIASARSYPLSPARQFVFPDCF